MCYLSKAAIGLPQLFASFGMLRNMGKGTRWGCVLLAFGWVLLPACERAKPGGVSQAPANVTSKPKNVVPEGLPYRAHGGLPLGPSLLTDAPAPVVRPAVPPPSAVTAPVDSLNGDPRGLTRGDLNRVMSDAVKQMSSCFTAGTPNPKINLSFEAEPSGRTSLLRVKGAPSNAEPCIRNIIQEMRLPSFEGKAVPVEMPLVFQAVEYKRVNPDNKAQAPAPSLFVQP
jgi:hypothetical protein